VSLKVTHQIVAADVTGRTVKVSAEANGACFIRWGDGTDEQMAQDQAPTDAGVIGLYSKQHVYGADGPKYVEVRSNEQRATFNVLLGKAPFPVHDPTKRRLTEQERWADEGRKAGAIMGTRDQIG
jgi:hypothetical protein